MRSREKERDMIWKRIGSKAKKRNNVMGMRIG
jgi:hypothetical protein